MARSGWHGLAGFLGETVAFLRLTTGPWRGSAAVLSFAMETYQLEEQSFASQPHKRGEAVQARRHNIQEASGLGNIMGSLYTA